MGIKVEEAHYEFLMEYKFNKRLERMFFCETRFTEA
jgi:hypothetical protein